VNVCHPAHSAVSDETCELLQCLGALDLRAAQAAQAAQAEHVPTCTLELGIRERSRLIERAAVAVVAWVEALPGLQAARVSGLYAARRAGLKRSQALSGNVRGEVEDDWARGQRHASK
jgi:hypothetical protein